MKKILISLIAIVAFFLFMGAQFSGDITIARPAVISDAPSAPFTCSVNYIGWLIYVDDTNDTSEAFICHCGTDADDSSYLWLRTDIPGTDCFP